MRRTPKVAAVSIGALIALAGCGSSTKTGSPAPTTPAPATTAAPSTSVPVTTAPVASVLNAAERTDLTLIHEQERAGLDAYSVFASRYTSMPVFANLASSQRVQLATVTAMMARYGLGDPAAGLTAGTYSDPTVQRLYESTVAAGSSADKALDAAENFEEQHLASLRAALTHTTRADLTIMYENLEKASTAHIAACNLAHLNS